MSGRRQPVVEYIIANGNGSYIKRDEFSGKFSEVSNVTLATSWSTYDKADNVRVNALTNKQKAQFHVEKRVDGCIADKRDYEQSYDCGAEPDSAGASKLQTCFNADVVKRLCEEPVGESCADELEERLSDFAKFVNEKLLQHDSLAKEQSIIDLEITDIEHYIEFHDLNAYQGWLIFKLLQQKLRERRVIKDSIIAITALEDCGIDTSAIRHAAVRIGNLKKRKYTPRALPELFK